jgi:hypothetical protein
MQISRSICYNSAPIELDAEMKVTWNPRMLKTAGVTYLSKLKRTTTTGDVVTTTFRHCARVELSRYVTVCYFIDSNKPICDYDLSHSC